MPLYSIIILSFFLGMFAGTILTAHFARREDEPKNT